MNGNVKTKQALENEWLAKDKIEPQSHFSIYNKNQNTKRNNYDTDLIAHSIFVKLQTMKIAVLKIKYSLQATINNVWGEQKNICF